MVERSLTRAESVAGEIGASQNAARFGLVARLAEESTVLGVMAAYNDPRIHGLPADKIAACGMSFGGSPNDLVWTGT
jgi:hypothetical protein